MGHHSGVFHVVCRECREEDLLDSRQAAETLATRHAESADHRVAYRRIE